MGPLEILAIIASIIALIAFTLNQYAMLSEDGLVYDLLFFVSSVVLTYYAIVSNVPPFIIINAAWVLISGIEIIRDVSRIFKNKKRRQGGVSFKQ